MKYRGVNLGGWLVLERWMTPSLFEGLQAKDEISFMQELGLAAEEKIERHHESYLTEDDIRWIADHGLNAVRLPLPHWAFGDVAPYIGCVSYIDWLMDMAKKHGLMVLLDVHTAPGSQNGWPHSGTAGSLAWHKDATNIEQTLDFITRLTQRYADSESLLGVELLNEPHPSLPQEALLDFYRQGIEAVKSVKTDLQVVVSDAFRPDAWGNTFLKHEPNLLVDMHLYQAFEESDKKLPMHKHIRKAQENWVKLIEKVQKTTPVIIGEWSLGLDNRAFRGMGDFERDKAMQAYAMAQLGAFEQSQGWFFWNYKTETMAGWSYRESMARGWLPGFRT